jgi:DNA polymerase-3 subunit gamma/tau
VSYLAIARKYRPATFDEIVGQRHVTRTLTNAIAQDRIHHAYLFTGARGVGKTTAARALARALNCAEGPTATPCGVCTSCVEIGLGSSPDLIEIDGASNNSVDDVREIREAVQYAPAHGRRKIYLVDEVHMLSKAAFNALLKTLEEPPPHIVFIFATTEPNKIPDTILSRVQRFDFKRIGLAEVVERLGEIATAEGVRIGPSGLRLIARAGEGSMRDAQSLLDQVIAYGGQDITDAQIQETLGLIDQSSIHAFLRGLLHGDPAACLEVIDRVHGYGHELSVFTAEALELLRHATLIRLSPDVRRFVDLAADEVDELDALTRDVDPERLSRLFTALLEVHDQVARASRPRIVLEMAVARLAHVRPVRPLGALLERIETLERQLRGHAGPPQPQARPPRSDARPPQAGPPPSAPRSSRARPGPRESADDPREGSPPEPAPPPEPPPSVADAWGVPTEPTSSLIDMPIRPATVARRAPPGPRPDPTTPEGRWRLFRDDLRDDPQAEPLIAGEPLLVGDRLRVVVKPGRPLTAARKAAASVGVAAALAARYPPGTALIVEAQSARTQSPTATLEREFLADPALQRIVAALGATVERVEPAADVPPEPHLEAPR